MTCNRSVVFSGYSVFSTNKTDRHDIAEILLQVALNAITLTQDKTFLMVCISLILFDEHMLQYMNIKICYNFVKHGRFSGPLFLLNLLYQLSDSGSCEPLVYSTDIKSYYTVNYSFIYFQVILKNRLFDRKSKEELSCDQAQAKIQTQLPWVAKYVPSVHF